MACPRAGASSACSLLEAIHGQVLHVHEIIALHPIWTNSEFFFGLLVEIPHRIWFFLESSG